MAVKGKTQQPLEAPDGGPRRDLVWAGATAVGLIVCAVGLFVAGFFTQDLVSDDDNGGTVSLRAEDRASPTAQPTAVASPTAAPVVEVSAGDAPAWGPEDAKVTIVEFTDYQ